MENPFKDKYIAVYLNNNKELHEYSIFMEKFGYYQPHSLDNVYFPRIFYTEKIFYLIYNINTYTYNTSTKSFENFLLFNFIDFKILMDKYNNETQ